MPSYKLVYFAGKGVAEKARFLFALSETEYEDFRFPLNFGTPGDFSTIQRPEFDAYKAEGKLDASIGVLPQLWIDGTSLVCQSKTIERYLAKVFGFFGSNTLEEATVDALTEHERDLKTTYQKVDKKDPAAVEKWWAEDFGIWMEKIEKALPAKGSTPFLVGEKMSLADLCFFHLVTDFFTESEKAKTVMKAKAPRLSAAVEAVAADPKIQKWLATRPDTPF